MIQPIQEEISFKLVDIGNELYSIRCNGYKIGIGSMSESIKAIHQFAVGAFGDEEDFTCDRCGKIMYQYSRIYSAGKPVEDICMECSKVK